MKMLMLNVGVLKAADQSCAAVLKLLEDVFVNLISLFL